MLLVTNVVSIGVIAKNHQIKEEMSLELEDNVTIISNMHNKTLDLEKQIEFLESEVERLQNNYKLLEDDYKLLEVEYDELKRSVEKSNSVSRGGDGKVLLGTFEATAYDLSVASCGKSESHPAYGITANGTSLKGHTLESARAIAVDPKVIKLGSTVYVEFLDEGYKHLTGEFQAVDTGGAIKGSKIDVFFGSGDVAEQVKQFGRRKVKVWIVK